ncbi:hypothetical protein [Rhodanobacter ginsengiterrae]|uniref:hypothetical protein n=1 Tax=Rhodanobacter ginsengiterrae TaxID=2008451 RepID=UPI003CF4B33C
MDMSNQMNRKFAGRVLSVNEVEQVSGGVLVEVIVGAAIAAGVALFKEGCELGKQMAERDNAR